MAPDPGDRAGELGDGVAAVDHRTMTRIATGGQLHPGHALLGRRDEIDPLAAPGRGESADLTDGPGAVRELVGMGVAEVLRALVPTGLHVGGEAKPAGTVRHRTAASTGPAHR